VEVTGSNPVLPTNYLYMSRNEQLPDNQRVVVTGMGAVTPLGLDVITSWRNLEAGRGGIVSASDSPLAAYPKYEELGAKVVGTVPDFVFPSEFKDYGVKIDQKNMHRSAQLGISAVYEALKQADLLDEKLLIDAQKVDPFRAGLYIGSTFSGMDHAVEAMNQTRLAPSDLFKSLPARAATSEAMQYRAGNLSPLLGWECASGAVTVDIGARALLRYRDDMPPISDVVIAGGVDAPVAPANLKYFGALKTAVSPSTDPIIASRPFDNGANGLIMGEAGGAVVLETWEHAKARGLKPEDIQAELVGYASFTDAESKTKAGMEGAVRAMTQAAHMARVMVGETVYINAHATSTGEGDPIEARIIQEFIRRQSLKPEDIWVTSTKGATGHTMGAAGSIEAVFSISALQKNIIPPALNLDSPIEEIRGFNLNPHTSKTLDSVDIAISNSLGFGGGVTALAFRKFKE
jgi:3-oxoacyl-[acyl-carrier-protein] synthase II